MKRSLFAIATFAFGIFIFLSVSCERDTTVRLNNSTLQVVDGQLGKDFPPVEIWVDNVANLGAFQFDIVYDTAIVGRPQVTLREFLSKTHRTVTQVGPDTITSMGRITFGAATSGQKIAGANGSGILATIKFHGRAAGTTSLKLERVLLAEINGKPIKYRIQESAKK